MLLCFSAPIAPSMQSVGSSGRLIRFTPSLLESPSQPASFACSGRWSNRYLSLLRSITEYFMYYYGQDVPPGTGYSA